MSVCGDEGEGDLSTRVGQQLIDVKEALDSGAVTKDEYEKERKKILNHSGREKSSGEDIHRSRGGWDGIAASDCVQMSPRRMGPRSYGHPAPPDIDFL